METLVGVICLAGVEATSFGGADKVILVGTADTSGVAGAETGVPASEPPAPDAFTVDIVEVAGADIVLALPFFCGGCNSTSYVVGKVRNMLLQ